MASKKKNGIPKWRYEERVEQAEEKSRRRRRHIKKEKREEKEEHRKEIEEQVNEAVKSKYNLEDKNVQVELNQNYNGERTVKIVIYEDLPYFDGDTVSVSRKLKVKDILDENESTPEEFEVIEPHIEAIEDIKEEKDSLIEEEKENLEHYRNYLLDTTGDELADYDPNTDYSGYWTNITISEQTPFPSNFFIEPKFSLIVIVY